VRGSLREDNDFGTWESTLDADEKEIRETQVDVSYLSDREYPASGSAPDKEDLPLALPLMATIPAGATDAQKLLFVADEWLEVNTPAAYDASDPSARLFEFPYLLPDTQYRFSLLFISAAGQGPPSDASIAYRTLQQTPVDLHMHVGPPCIYFDPRKRTTFAASGTGSGLQYTWQTPNGNVIAGSGYQTLDGRDSLPSNDVLHSWPNNCLADDCSSMEWVFPNIGPETVELVAANKRGQRQISTAFTVEYCGCTDPFDANYWDRATFHVPDECADYENWSGAGACHYNRAIIYG
jgi:hypothetical protein